MPSLRRCRWYNNLYVAGLNLLYNLRADAVRADDHHLSMQFIDAVYHPDADIGQAA